MPSLRLDSSWSFLLGSLLTIVICLTERQVARSITPSTHCSDILHPPIDVID